MKRPEIFATRSGTTETGTQLATGSGTTESGDHVQVERGEPKPLPLGTIVDDYILGTPLGSGGFGTVYSAQHKSTGEPVALKLLHEHVAAHEKLRARFAREVEAIQKLDHPGIVKCLADGTYQGNRPYLVMEHLQGVDLARLLRTSGPMNAKKALKLFDRLCRALAFAHDHKILHRDIKASNVFVARTDSGVRVVLLDFGIAKTLDHAGPQLTSTGKAPGTPGNMAPEQLRGQKPSVRTDVYALGVVLFRMLTGTKPFAGVGPDLQQHMHLHGARPRPSTYAPTVSPSVDQVVTQAMCRTPEGRFSGPLEMLEALREAAAMASPVAPSSGRQEVIVVEVTATAERLNDPEERFLDYVDEVNRKCLSRLSNAGFERVESTGRTQLFARPAARSDSSEILVSDIEPEILIIVQAVRQDLVDLGCYLDDVDVLFRIDVVPNDELHLVPRSISNTSASRDGKTKPSGREARDRQAKSSQLEP